MSIDIKVSESVDVAIGVLNGKVVASWHTPMTAIEFEPKNAYQIGMALSKAAMEANRGYAAVGDELMIGSELTREQRITDALRDKLVQKIAFLIPRIADKSDGFKAMTIVDQVLNDVP